MEGVESSLEQQNSSRSNKGNGLRFHDFAPCVLFMVCVMSALLCKKMDNQKAEESSISPEPYPIQIIKDGNNSNSDEIVEQQHPTQAIIEDGDDSFIEPPVEEVTPMIGNSSFIVPVAVDPQNPRLSKTIAELMEPTDTKTSTVVIPSSFLKESKTP